MNNSSGSSDGIQRNDDDNSINSGGDDFADTVPLDEEVLRRLRNNDPELLGLEINIRDEDMTSSIDWQKDGKYISENKNLKSVYLDEWSANPNVENIKALLRAISCNRSIKCIDICQCSIDSGELIEIVTPFLQNNARIRTLYMSNLELDDKSAQLLSSALASCAGSLRGFDLHSNGVISNMSAGRIVASLNNHASLKELTLSLNNNDKQWCIELGKLLQNPTSKLEELNLGHNEICNESAFVLGGAIARSKLKEIHLNELESITSLGWIALASGIVGCSSIEEIEANYNDELCDEVAVVLANALVVNPSLAVLDLRHNSIGDSGVMAIGYGLANNTTLKNLVLSHSRSISSAGWRTFFGILRNSNYSLEKLFLSDNSIDDEGVIAIIDTFGTTLKLLRFVQNPLITIVGFRALATLVYRANSCLENLGISPAVGIIDEVMLSFSNALVNPNTMKSLYLGNCLNIIRGWTALSNVLCNKTDIESICASNHTLQIGPNIPHDIKEYYELNKSEDKIEVARQKIIKYHFLNGESNIDKFVKMELTELPQAISWVGRNNTGASLLYTLCKSVPTLFDSESKAKVAECRKRKADGL